MTTEMKRELTTTEYIILGLINSAPQTGYGIIGTLENVTSRWSASAGAIYPALKRLERQGLIEGTVEMVHEVRGRKVYRITPAGETLLDNWLRSPLAPNDILGERETALIKFLFAEQRLPREEVLAWLDTYEEGAATYDATHSLWQKAMLNVASLHQQLVVEATQMELNMQRSWIQRARERLQLDAKSEPVKPEPVNA